MWDSELNKRKIMDALEKILGEHFRQLSVDLSAKFVEIPSQSCGCGKPVVFTSGAKEFHCSRCEAKWVLKVEVVKVPV
jgi:LSD1 subclass zinc finger protein